MNPRAGSAPTAALPAVDALKAAASQLIVWHHLAFYGPMAELAAPLWPALFDALSRHARIAVQAFLVVGGFLAARSLAPEGRLAGGPPLATRLLERYMRLALPLAAVLLMAVTANALTRGTLAGDVVPAPPQAGQVLAHLLLLQDLLGVPALSAGLWYVAIDFQLFALLCIVLAACAAAERRWPGAPPLAPVAVLALTTLSMWWWNRVPALDVWASYFVGAYGLGALVAWWAPARRAWPLAAIAMVVLVALWLAPRSRVAVAAVVAASLAAAAWAPRAGPRPGRRLVAWLARISYAVFLVHFPIILLVNALFVRWLPPAPALQAAGLVLAWAASIAAGAAFHRWVEQPLLRRVRLRRPAPA